jgi:hypothetical protein
MRCLGVVLAALVLAGCGGSSSSKSSNSASAPCVITIQGNKLCGQDAESWCQLAESQAAQSGTGRLTDTSTASACYTMDQWAHAAADGVIAYNANDPNQGRPCYLNAPDSPADCVATGSPNATASSQGARTRTVNGAACSYAVDGTIIGCRLAPKRHK